MPQTGQANDALHVDAMPKRRQSGLTVVEVSGETLVYELHTHHVHCLNATTAFVWQQCTGQQPATAIAVALEREHNVPAASGVVWLALEQLDQADLLDRPSQHAGVNVSRRLVLRTVAAAGLAATVLPALSSITAPTPAMAVSLPPSGRPAGDPCMTPGQCASGFCVSGVCCATACTGTCQACSAALTGGTNGVCGTLTCTAPEPCYTAACDPTTGQCVNTLLPYCPCCPSECTTYSCHLDTEHCTHEAKPDGTACSAGVCCGGTCTSVTTPCNGVCTGGRTLINGGCFTPCTSEAQCTGCGYGCGMLLGLCIGSPGNQCMGGCPTGQVCTSSICFSPC